MVVVAVVWWNLLEISFATTETILEADNSPYLLMFPTGLTLPWSFFQMRNCQARGRETNENPGLRRGVASKQGHRATISGNHRHLTAPKQKFALPLILLTRCNSFCHPPCQVVNLHTLGKSRVEVFSSPPFDVLTLCQQSR
jgi:hypothetical protein